MGDREGARPYLRRGRGLRLIPVAILKRQLVYKTCALTRTIYKGYNETPIWKEIVMKKIAIAKKIISTIVGLGTAQIVKQIIENNVETDTTYQKVTVGTASVAIGYAVSDYTSEYTDTKIEEIVDLWQKHVVNRTKTDN